jgi:uncharacterized membrane protein YeaQ/YmgE (transglycosylase-associated protein family)
MGLLLEKGGLIRLGRPAVYLFVLTATMPQTPQARRQIMQARKGHTMLMNIIGWAVFGLIAGAIARLLVPGRQSMGILLTMLLGVIGSVVGGMISWAFTGGPHDEFQASGWIMSIVGAILVLVIWGYFAGEQRRV